MNIGFFRKHLRSKGDDFKVAPKKKEVSKDELDRGVRIIDNDVTLTQDDGIAVRGSENVLIQGNRVSHAYDNGVQVRRTKESKLELTPLWSDSKRVSLLAEKLMCEYQGRGFRESP